MGSNPLRFNDPSGNCANICLGLIAGTGAAVGAWYTGGSGGDIATAFGVGFVAGATLGFGTSLVAPTVVSGSAGLVGVTASPGAIAATSTLISGSTGAVVGDAITQGIEHARAGGSLESFDYSASRGLTAGISGLAGAVPSAVAGYSLATATALYGANSLPAAAYTLGVGGEITVGALDVAIGTATGAAIDQGSEWWNTPSPLDTGNDIGTFYPSSSALAPSFQPYLK